MGWDFETEHLGGFNVDHEFEAGGCLDGKVRRLRSLKNLIDEHGNAAEHLVVIRAIGHETAGNGEIPEL